MKKILKGQKGFSLVELSVVLTIIGITLASTLDLATQKTEAYKVKETNARMDAIEQAMQVFLLKYAYLPCPASSTAALNSSGAGAEVVSAGPPRVCNTTINNGTTYGIWEGAVPVKTLGLPDKMIADAWDRKFTYIVDNRYVNSAATATCSSTIGSQMCFKNTVVPNGADATVMTINDSTANSSSTRATDAIYVLISHGKNGNGAFTYGATTTAVQLTASADADEVSNAAVDDASFDATFVQADTSATFDDIVRYKSKAQMIDSVNGITDPITCLAAADNLITSTTTYSLDPCPGNTVTACRSLATQVNTFCLQP